MKKIGLVGGISWVSTIDYYKYINEGINAKSGGLNFAECIIYSLNFGDVQKSGWPNVFDLLLNACKSLKQNQVDAIALCANTAHLFAEQLQQQIQIPIIDIRIETAKAINKSGHKKVGLLGTKFTMEMGFYSDKLREYGLEILIPSEQETRNYIQQTVKEELGVGFINPDTKNIYLDIIKDLIHDGAECVVLGCTEIPMLINQQDIDIPIFDTTKIHCEAIVDYIIT